MVKVMTDDMTLLREYARRNSDEAFAALVSRHVNLVYSVALRDVHDPHLAEEITQAVFIILARKADSLGSKIILSGWLCRTARYVGARVLTVQRRRQQREQEAYMQSVLNEPEPDAWTQIAPLLSGAMEQLGSKDHDAVVLRFFEGKSFQEIGTALGASENAAKKRVAYALEKLRKFFLKNGVASTTGAIAVALSANSVHAAPAMLAKAVTVTAIAKGATASASTLALIKGALKIMAWTQAKAAIVTGIVVVLAGATAVVAVKAPHHSATVVKAPSDTTVLQGTWGEQEKGAAGESTLTIEGSNIEFHGANPNEWYRATFTLREDTAPKQLVAVIMDCPAPSYVGKTSYAIYQMQDGAFTFVGSEPGKPGPPADFDAPGGRKFVFTKK